MKYNQKNLSKLINKDQEMREELSKPNYQKAYLSLLKETSRFLKGMLIYLAITEIVLIIVLTGITLSFPYKDAVKLLIFIYGFFIGTLLSINYKIIKNSKLNKQKEELKCPQK